MTSNQKSQITLFNLKTYALDFPHPCHQEAKEITFLIISTLNNIINKFYGSKWNQFACISFIFHLKRKFIIILHISRIFQYFLYCHVFLKYFKHFSKCMLFYSFMINGVELLAKYVINIFFASFKVMEDYGMVSIKLHGIPDKYL